MTSSLAKPRLHTRRDNCELCSFARNRATQSDCRSGKRHVRAHSSAYALPVLYIQCVHGTIAGRNRSTVVQQWRIWGGGGGAGGALAPPPFSSPPFYFLLVVCVVSVTVHTTPALHGARRSPPKYVAQKARASPVDSGN